MRKLTDFPYQNVLVLGLAKSGTAVAQLLGRNGVRVIVNDWKTPKEDANVQLLEQQGVEVVVGSHPLSLLDNVEAVIKNPGIPYENPIIEKARERHIPVLTEVELIHYFGVEEVVAITGSNGKTTTTTLIYEMYQQANRPTALAGNIGHVASEVAEQMSEGQTMVVELSSFQLLGIEVFRPRIAVLLNIFSAHLDYHHTMEHYMEAKANITKNQTESDFLVYNADDQHVCQMIKDSEVQLVPFSRQKVVENGAYLDGRTIYFRGKPIIDIDSVVLVGDHNIENILAAICVAKVDGLSNQAIYAVLTSFTGVKHRLQFVREWNGRRFYNDSKATNILATSKALSAFKQPVILLAGGLDRGNEFDELIPYMSYVKSLIVFGQTSEKLAKVGQALGISNIIYAENVAEAVEKAYPLSEEQDVILLSPACASWDQYKTFEERGNMFIDAVHKL
ncbi:UDP-N-acetylmuramoyl-L-alanine--D-glutamate ligase [Gracilibacillus alcaliphilus]|uniref:UDP-N-acetylmuramoyl-L-alanine--D-glutamate ligase n=1 Tax=Gracilibacillus alcaliphilus TaxID=1401441 RepID=UPI0019567D87|nr:UDP-N-acetylmuramoyl-L-alanine--D-glutamate ligase [Gracilibacillus alcaliphilus]MBM7678623.1 UDP-N-acetylmuramoylalanine--D-glutamate ligase [Gracilibacillus alcaliphilus]